MNLHKSTRYALHAMVELAHAGDRAVAVGWVAARFDISEAALAKVMQQLVRSRLVLGVRGVGGGYRLARAPSDVSVQDVIDIFEPPPPPDTCALRDQPGAPCPIEEPECRLRTLLDEVDQVVRSTFRSVTLDTLSS
jgi:Rrf2 family iron-sulfur cluster assembly transcriptional regulator